MEKIFVRDVAPKLIPFALHSCSNNYRSALQQEDLFLGKGAKNVVILAYDVSKMESLLDASMIASYLGLQQLQFYKDELLAVSKSQVIITACSP
jgi:hypothetical protein